ncbi:MAG: ATP-dependent Clp protease adaptor ClpS [Bacteroidales bacterium]|jgi:ATP-dependent Clp protease adaptor protein ClpS|nr:ATP-dependent Clp protease adaptor ClpS [Bacteroidales bacterium]
MNGREKRQTEAQITENVLREDVHTLWLINDDFNTFDFVVDSLMELCGHSYVQAMQCTFITHNQGKCDILKGAYLKLEMIALTMLNRGLTVTITE